MDFLSSGVAQHVDSSASESSKVTTSDTAYHSVGVDLQHSEKCLFDMFLSVMLSRCRSEPTQVSRNPEDSLAAPSIPQSAGEITLENSSIALKINGTVETSVLLTDTTSSAQEPDEWELNDSDLFQHCLQKVLPLCNNTEFRNMFKHYCDTPPNNQRYAPFTAACNYALQQLQALDVSHLRSSDCNILFHVNHHGHICGYGQAGNAPDIAIVSLPASRLVHEEPGAKWSEMTDKRCQEYPLRSFKWPEVLAFVKFKGFGPIQSRFCEEFDQSCHAVHPAKTISNAQGLGDSAIHASANPSSQSSASGNSSRSQGDDDARTPYSENRSAVTHATSVGTPANNPTTTHRIWRFFDQFDTAIPFEQTGSKRRRSSHWQDTGRGLTQSGGYAAEMLSAVAGRTHAIGLFVVDQVVWVWWYDRQGAIQTTGIDLVLDLPRFVVLLLAFQRFSRADWGYHPELDPEPGFEVEAMDTSATANSRDIQFEELGLSVDLSSPIYSTFSLVGRGTNVLVTESTHPSVASTSLGLKLSWLNKARASERSIIEHVIKGAPSAENHLPKVFASRDIHDTEVIRARLGIHEKSRRSFRVLRMAVFERLVPLASVSGLTRISAYVQCLKCHYLVWQAGVQHRDLSMSNLMVRRRGDDDLGVLNDWDLSFVKHLCIETNKHTGTLPFLSLDLLQPACREGKITVEYRHDLESFVWIIYWLARCSKSSDGSPPADLLEWGTSVRTCYLEKSVFLKGFEPDPSPATIEWQVATPLLSELQFEDARRYYSKTKRDMGDAIEHQPESDRQLLDRFLQLIPPNLSVDYQIPNDPVVD